MLVGPSALGAGTPEAPETEHNLMGEDNFDAIIKLLRDNNFEIKIGILENNARTAKNAGDSGAVSNLGNADVGAIAEFGGWSNGARIPRRSWLRMPLETQYPKYLRSNAQITEETLKRAIKAGTLDPLAVKMARAALDCINDAFDSGGFGIWPPHSPNTHSATGQLLQDTKQLKNAVSYEIVKKKA